MMQICDASQCTGCFACRNICPKGAIFAAEDENRKTIPKIDEDKCISCGLCQKVCPVNNKPQLNKAPHSYAAWSKEDEDFKLSSSGGAASVFTRKILNDGGKVYGAACADSKVKHIRADSFDDIAKLRGSKYVQSDTELIFKDVKAQLSDNKKVMFIGTPCQVAGLKNFLRKDYDNLLTVDLVCHGTPPYSYLKEHIEHKLNDKKWDSFSFRGKYDYFLTVYNEDEIVYQQKRNNDEYFTAFSFNLIFRDNCYSCEYSRPERVSDITIGDFWGIDRSKMQNDSNGHRISLILPNTDKGEAFFESCKDSLVWEKHTIEEALNPEQGNLLRPSSIHPARGDFLKALKSVGFDDAVCSTSLWKETLKQNKKNKIKGTLRKIKKNILG